MQALPRLGRGRAGRARVLRGHGGHRMWCEGVFVTCGRYTEPARQFAQGKPIRLIDGEELMAMLQAANPVTPKVVAYSAPLAPEPPASGGTPTPTCPTCHRPMVRRMAKKGEHAGKAFWGCPNYPACRGIVRI